MADIRQIMIPDGTTYDLRDSRVDNLPVVAVADVTVDGTSVVSNNVAQIDLTGKADIDGIASATIGAETDYNTKYINWTDSDDNRWNLSVSDDGKTLSVNKYNGSAWTGIWSQDMTDLEAKHMWKSYTITRTTNTYFNATSVARIKLYRYGHFGQLFLNLQPTTTMPASTSSVEVGKFACTFANEMVAVVASQSGLACNLLVTVGTNGSIKVGNQTTTASGTGFYRTVIPMIFTDSSN